MDNQQIVEQLNQDIMTEQMPKQEGKAVNPIDPNYTPPFMLSSRKAKREVRTQLEFLKKLSSI